MAEDGRQRCIRPQHRREEEKNDNDGAEDDDAVEMKERRLLFLRCWPGHSRRLCPSRL